MVSFQQDFFLTIYKSHEVYNDKIQKLLNNKSLTQDLSLAESEKLIKYLKIYKKQINEISTTVSNIINVKEECNMEEKIEKELLIKIMPIMNVYRTLLNEKYTSYSSNVSNVSNVSNERNVSNDISESPERSESITQESEINELE
jgi:hypothetical protein